MKVVAFFVVSSALMFANVLTAQAVRSVTKKLTPSRRTAFPNPPSATSPRTASPTTNSPLVSTNVATDPPSSTLTPTITFSPTKPVAECWDNTTHIFLHLQRQEPSTHNTYILCPHTRFNIGYTDQGQCCENGDLPIFGRANTHYLCGIDGKSSNNCTLYGGTTQVSIDEIIFPGAATNVLFQGITFQAAANYVALPSSPGDFTFLDCIFQDHQNRGLFIMFMFPKPLGGRRRRLLDKKKSLKEMDLWTKLDYLNSNEYLQEVREITEQYKTGEHINDYLDVDNNNELILGVFDDRQLQDTGVDKYTKITGNWINCIFQNNKQGPIEGFTTFGILTSMEPRNFMNFDGCLFLDNDYGSSGQSTGYAIKSDGSAIGINNSCFMKNKFKGAGPVQALNGTQVEFKDVYGTQDEGVTCDFIAYNPNLPSDSEDVTCTNYDLSSCKLSILPELPSSATGTSEELSIQVMTVHQSY